MKIRQMYEHPFGQGYRDRNRVEQYLRAIFIAVDNEDGLALEELFEELTLEQWTYLNGLLASYTRKKIKELT